MKLSKKIIVHLLKNDEFLSELDNVFNQEQKSIIIDSLRNNIHKYPSVMDDFYDWLEDTIFNAEEEILCISWDSENWGAGGNGFVGFYSIFNLVILKSSDYSSNHVEVFKKNSFRPWCIESLCNEYVELTSNIYNEQELIELANYLGIDEEETTLTVNGKEIKKEN